MARKIEEWLVVDGYNVIGLDRRFKWTAKNLEEARVKLIQDLSEYQAITGRRVVLVFDAHRTSGRQVTEMQEKIEVVYTQKEETADEFIEQFVRKNKSPHRNIYVATSDYLEQRMVFGQGAYRISSRELVEEIATAKQKLSQTLLYKKEAPAGNKLGDLISSEVRKKFENWRRKK